LLSAPIVFFLENSWLVALALALLINMAAQEWPPRFQIVRHDAMIYLIVLAVSDGFSFQYFAWSLPFWFFLPRWFFIPAIVLAGAYIHFLYALFVRQSVVTRRFGFQRASAVAVFNRRNPKCRLSAFLRGRSGL